MNRETLKIVQKLDRESLEVQLLLQCAPMIAGLKASNLLIIASENEEDARKILNGTRISCVRLARMDKKTTMLIYHERWLKEYLASEEVIRLLCVLGYEGKGFYEVLHSVKEKYRSYIGKREISPMNWDYFWAIRRKMFRDTWRIREETTSVRDTGRYTRILRLN